MINVYRTDMKKLIDKKSKKKHDGKCYFCGISEYELLDVHRMLEGKDGGKYTEFNTICSCSNCHRKIHAGKITIHGRHYSSSGKYVLHYTNEEGEEVWK